MSAPAAGTPHSEGPLRTTAATVVIHVNGTETVVPLGLTVSTLLDHLKLPLGRVAVERNRRVVPRVDHAMVAVEEGDQYEIVTFVGGG